MCKILRFPIERTVPGQWGNADEEFCVRCEIPVEVDRQLDMFADLVDEKVPFAQPASEGSDQRHWCDNCQAYTVWRVRLSRLIEC